MQDHLQQAGPTERVLRDVDHLPTHDSVAKYLTITTVDNANLKAGKADGEPAVGGVDDLDDLTAQEVDGIVHADLGVAEGSLASAASTGCSVHCIGFVNGLHHQSPATRRLRGGWLGSLGEPVTSRWKRRTRRRPLRRSLRSPTPQGGQWPRRPWSCPMPSAMP